MRYFGVGPWTILDGSLIIMGISSALFGIKGFIITRKYEKMLAGKLEGFMTMSWELGDMNEE